MNLFVNAAQLIEDKGTIKIETFTDSTNVYIKISDTGRGIPPENLARIFDPGFTTKSSRVGMDLDLSISYNIIQKHKGDIKLSLIKVIAAMVQTQYKTLIQRVFSLFLVFGLLAINIGCAQKGLVAEKYSSDFYRVPKLLPDEPMDKNPKFIVYGDSKPGWRVNEKFLKKKNWLTWKMLLFPFYEVYWLGNGLAGGINWLQHTPDYGIQGCWMVRDAIYAEAKRSKIDFILNMGDMIGDGRRPSHWAKFLRENKIERPLVSDFPFLPVVGNHEKVNDPIYGLPNYEAIFEYPQFYVLDFPDAALFVVDSNIIIDQYQFIDDDEQDALFEKWFVSAEDSDLCFSASTALRKNKSLQPAWLEQELASRNQSFKIVVMHHPLASLGKHYSDWTKPSSGRNLQKKRQQLIKLFYEQGVQLVLHGHEHLYEHTILRSRGQSPDPTYGNQTEHGIHFIVNGSGCAPLRSPSDAQKIELCCQNYRAEGFDVLLVKQKEIYHYSLVDIAPDKITIQILEVTGDATHPIRLVEEIIIPKS